MVKRTVSAGTVELPTGWEHEVTARFIEPADPILNRAPATLVVGQYASPAKTGVEARERFLSTDLPKMPPATKGESGELTFSDGVTGAWVELTFDLPQQGKLTQRYGFRIDGGRVTQLIVTVEERRKAELGTSLLSLITNFTL